MWVRFALAAVAMTALHDGAAADPRTVLSQTAASPPATIAAPMPQTQAEPGEQPPFKPMTFPARGDGLDEWCKEVKSGSIVAMCSDDELRALAVERLRAFNAASSRLPPDRQKILAADQNGWALSYPQRCSLPSNVLPSLPLAPEVRECLGKGGPIAARPTCKAYGSPRRQPARRCRRRVQPQPRLPRNRRRRRRLRHRRSRNRLLPSRHRRLPRPPARLGEAFGRRRFRSRRRRRAAALPSRRPPIS